MRAWDILTKPVYTVRDTDTIEEAAALLADKKITAAPVLDSTGALVGMVSESDLLWHRVPPDPTAHPWRVEEEQRRPKRVAEVMSARPLTTVPQADVADIARTMLYHEVRSMPVLDDGKIIGIVSRRDIVRTVIRTDDVLAREIQDRLDGYGGAGRWSVSVHDAAATIDGDFDDETERNVVTVMARTVPGVRAAHLTGAIT